MNEVISFLQENPVQYLGTIGRDGKAKCRPFMFAGELEGRLWFCTNNTKEVYKDMQANPYIELSVSSPSYAWIRLSGEAVFENNMGAKEMCMQNPIVKSQYDDAKNPIFEVFYLKNAHAVISDFSGNPPKEYHIP
ncbi:pyridoxamine 5'-phosphate oxidase [Clostridium sp. MCC353]|uniref:pyridoxamine 5'-phosphate oxidase family protein n=1 Tax=Clostridium sp. MCC353 TaxID=2592646 RepID=UPI001C0182BB|nr:pyridoxamine 5'-phosphate oxidase family protein [Clostridium sp. MCC353]MBT9778114.1 pyridoxamine 5'-phosphate oxidase [Clostridium sp. MCC353]